MASPKSYANEIKWPIAFMSRCIVKRETDALFRHNRVVSANSYGIAAEARGLRAEIVAAGA